MKRQQGAILKKFGNIKMLDGKYPSERSFSHYSGFFLVKCRLISPFGASGWPIIDPVIQLTKVAYRGNRRT